MPVVGAASPAFGLADTSIGLAGTAVGLVVFREVEESSCDRSVRS
jgi:hypothetical protein